MNDDQPHFRFNPNAYQANRAFERSDDVCGVCSRPCVWKYVRNIYAAQRPTVCARCIASGELGRFFGDKHFCLHDIELRSADPELEAEVLERTPGVACFNPFNWPVSEGIPFAFIGYGDDQKIIASPEAQAAIESAYSELGWDFDGPGSPYALVFKELEGTSYCAAIDLD